MSRSAFLRSPSWVFRTLASARAATGSARPFEIRGSNSRRTSHCEPRAADIRKAGASFDLPIALGIWALQVLSRAATWTTSGHWGTVVGRGDSAGAASSDCRGGAAREPARLLLPSRTARGIGGGEGLAL